MAPLFDAHIHLSNFKDISPAELIGRLKFAGIQKCVCVSAHPDDWAKAAAFARSFEFEVVPCFGLHPWYINDAHQGWAKRLEEYLLEFETALIGECGFDRLKNSDFESAKKVFEPQLELAYALKRPLMLHMVKADDWLENYFGRLPQNSIFHSFSGSIELCKRVLKFGHLISVNKKFFNKKDAAKILEYTPLENILIETDAPFQSMPEDLSAVASKIAEIKGCSEEGTRQRLYMNALEKLVVE